MSLETRFLETRELYDGRQLAPHFLLREHTLRGSAIAAWMGPAQVSSEHMVDWEDRLAKDHIRAENMVHFVGEFFGMGLREGVLFQRLLMATLGEIIAKQSGERVSREGDDLMIRGKKASVSIVTASPVSVLLHAAVNIDATGAPVEAIGLGELGWSEAQCRKFAEQALASISAEWSDLSWACAKVRPVV